MATLAETLIERKSQHGDFTDHARYAQRIKTILHSSINWTTLTDVQAEALEMIAHKMARIIAGNANHEDHWHDIAGYAKLAEDRIPREPPE